MYILILQYFTTDFKTNKNQPDLRKSGTQTKSKGVNNVNAERPLFRH